MRTVSRWFPDIRLSDSAFDARHRVLLVLLWLQVPLLAIVVQTDIHEPGPGVQSMPMGVEAATVWSMIAAVALTGFVAVLVRSRTARSLAVSTGLLLSAATLIPAGGGLTDLHFYFFVVVGLISVYQDWVLLAVSVALVAVYHLTMGILAPDMLYSDPLARRSPVLFAAVHVTFVLLMCAVELGYWRFAQLAESERDRLRLETGAAMRRSEERFRTMVQDSADVTVVIDDDGQIRLASPGVLRVLGYRVDELIGAGYRELVHPDDLPRFALPDSGDTDAGRLADRRVEARIRQADGGWHWYDVTLRDLSDNPAVGGVVVNLRDITERRSFQDRLLYEASHDALTGLANRSAFLRALTAAVADASQAGSRVAVLYLDLDGFKQVNDLLGHESGDALLVATAEVLRGAVAGSDVPARLGGDEFGIVLVDAATTEQAHTVAARILADLAALPDVPARPQASIGIALSEPGSTDVDAIIRHADRAMYRAKAENRRGWPGPDGPGSGLATTTVLEAELADATRRGELRLHYQPLVSLDDGTIMGFEALVRWQHPTRGLLAPCAFILIAEASGLIDELGIWVVEDACAAMRGWQRRYPDHPRLTLTVNLAPSQLDSSSLATEVLDILRRTGLDPHDLVVEVTESAMVRDQSAIPQLTALNDAGIRIALDDFGTGYSSLRYLTRLPVDILKLDRCFVAELDATPAGSAVARSVAQLGDSLHLGTIAEGIETPAQAAELTLLGYRIGQGFWYGRPLAPDAVDELLASAGAGWRYPVGTSVLSSTVD